MREKLYWKINRFSFGSLLFDYFLFFDTTPYLADQLFIRHKVRVWFDREYSRKGSPYLAIMCHVRKRDAAKFDEALEDLKKNMVVCGHPHYEEEINKSLDAIEEIKGGLRNDKNDSAEEAKQEKTA